MLFCAISLRTRYSQVYEIAAAPAPVITPRISNAVWAIPLIPSILLRKYVLILIIILEILILGCTVNKMNARLSKINNTKAIITSIMIYSLISSSFLKLYDGITLTGYLLD